MKIDIDWGFVQCDCGVKLWETHDEYHEYPTQESVDARVATLLAEPVVREEMKEIKKAATAMKKAHTAFSAQIRGLNLMYKEQSAQHIIALKQLRDATKSTIMQSAEYKAHKRTRNAINTLQAKFKAKHNLSSREFRHMFGYTNRSMPLWNYRYYTTERMLRRILRTVI